MEDEIIQIVKKFQDSPQELPRFTKELLEKSVNFFNDLLKENQENPTFENTCLPICYHDGDLVCWRNVIRFVQDVSTNSKSREESSKATQSINEYLTAHYLRDDVYKRLKVIQKKEETSLSKLDNRCLTRLLRNFERNGLNQDDSKVREEILKLKQIISKNEITFSSNIRNDTTHFFFPRSELEGMNDDFLNSLEKNDKGEYRVSLKYPEVLPVLKFCSVEKTRDILSNARNSQCIDVNPQLYEKTVSLRKELAKLLGFKDYPSYKLDIKIAKTPENVLKFLNEIKEGVSNTAKEELANLIKMKEKEVGGKVEFLKLSDYMYFNRKSREEKFQIDMNLISEYFPIDHVISSTLEVYSSLLIVKFKEIEKVPSKWFKAVRLFEMNDLESGILIGKFVLDLFPRDGKYTHGCVRPLRLCYFDKNGERVVPMTAMLTNFAKPTTSRPSLLMLEQVKTFFHEFGHLMHSLLTQVKYSNLSGIFEVEHDFLEFPSQMMENWIYDKEMLKKLSKHYKSGDSLSDENCSKISEMRTFNLGIKTLMQLSLSMFDILSYYEEELNSQQLMNKLKKEVSNVIPDENTNKTSNFNHVMADYEVGYYSYRFSEVFSHDAFSLFKKCGLFSEEAKKLGIKYRKNILEMGGSEKGVVMLKNFIGREPSNEAFFKFLGVKNFS